MKNLILSVIFYFKSETHKRFLMAKAMADSSFKEIEKLHSLGISFPNDKAPYSYLFQRKDHRYLKAQLYVIKNIDDISFGNQVILRTLLHPTGIGISKSNEMLIKAVLEKYTEQYTSEKIVELIYKIFGERFKTQNTLLVKEFYEQQVHKKQVEALTKELEEKANGVIKNERKRIKI